MATTQPTPTPAPTSPTQPAAPAPAVAQSAADTVTAGAYPGAFGLFKPSSQAIRLELANFAILWGILIAISIVLGLLTGNYQTTMTSDSLDWSYSSTKLIGQLVNFVVNLLIGPMIAFMLLQAVRGVKESVGSAFSYALKNLLRFFVANLLVVLAVIAGLILLIIPGLYIGLRLSLTSYVLVDRPELSGMDAVKESWKLTRGNVGKVLGIYGAYLVMLLPIITIIGILVTVVLVILYSAAIPLLYVWIAKNSSQQMPPTTPAAPNPAAPTAPTAA